MRAIYTLLWYLALPLLPLRLLWRGRREPGYREHVGERYGQYRGAVPKPVLWVHAVSSAKHAPRRRSSTGCAARIPGRPCC